jgi:hypothetical protein
MSSSDQIYNELVTRLDRKTITDLIKEYDKDAKENVIRELVDFVLIIFFKKH